MKSWIRRGLGVFVGIILTAIFLVVPVSAEENQKVVISLRPSEQELDLKAGQKYNGSVVVYNVGDKKFSFEASVAPYQIKKENYEQDFLTESKSTQLANWIRLEQTEYEVLPNQSATVKFNADIPQGVPGGGQYAAIIIRLKNDGQSSGGVNIVSQVAAILHGHVAGDGLTRTGELVKYDFPGIMLGNKFHVVTRIANTGNVDFKVRETLTVRDFFTNKELMTPSTATQTGYPTGTITATVMPDTERELEMTWKGAPQLGIFRVKHTIDYLEENTETEKIVLLCPLWLMVMLIVMITMMFIWIITAFINYKKDQPQVL